MSGGHNRNQPFASIGESCRAVTGHLVREARNHAECGRFKAVKYRTFPVERTALTKTLHGAIVQS